MSVIEGVLDVVTVAILRLSTMTALVYAFWELAWFWPVTVHNQLFLIFLTFGIAWLVSLHNPSIIGLLQLRPSHAAWATGAHYAARRAMQPVVMNAVPLVPHNAVFKGVFQRSYDSTQ